MFKELLPMVRNRKVTIVIKHNEDESLTVNVVPIQIRPDENPALCTPLSDTGVTGTAEDFDREFPQALTAYVAQHLSLAAALAQSAAEMETAKKSAADAAKQSSKDASEKWKKTKAGAPTTVAATPATPPVPSAAPSLFDAPAPPTPSDTASAMTPAATSLFDASPAELAAVSTESDHESDDSENADFEFEDSTGDENNEEEQVACVA
jgi:PRTRC genetic system protein E